MWPSARAPRGRLKIPPRVSRNPQGVKCCTGRWMCMIPKRLLTSSRPWKRTSGVSTFELPIPVSLRLTCLGMPRRKPGAALNQLLMSTIYFSRETLPRRQKNKWGRLITITSSAVKQPVDGLLLSNSIRAAVTGLARTLANKYAAHGIKVNNVCPGYTRIARTDDLASTIPACTGSKREEVIAFLASERASYVNGTSIAVEGGLARSLL